MRITQVPITLDFPAEAPPCCCGEPAVCLCSELPATLYARVYQRQYLDDNSCDMEWTNFYFTLQEGDHGLTTVCGAPAVGVRRWYGTWDINWLGGEYACDTYALANLLQMTCVSGSALALGFCQAYRLLTALPDTFEWRNPLATVGTQIIQCEDIESFAIDVDQGVSPTIAWIRRLQIQTTPFA